MQFEQFLFKLTKNAFSFGPFSSLDSLPLSGTPDKVTDKDEVKTASNKYTQLPKKVVKLLTCDSGSFMIQSYQLCNAILPQKYLILSFKNINHNFNCICHSTYFLTWIYNFGV